MEKKFNFIYITTNLINSKQYIGEHSTNNLNSTQEKRYLGSGNLINLAIKKNSRKNFKREILEFFLTKQEAFNAQEKYIIQYNTLSPNGYNISPKGGMGVSGCWSKESKIKNSKSHCGIKFTPEHLKNMSLAQQGRVFSDETINLMSKAKKGKTYEEMYNDNADTMRQKRSDQTSGSGNPMFNNHFYNIWVEKYGKELADVMFQLVIEKITNKSKGEGNGMFGKQHKKESKDKMREKRLNAEKILCPYCNKICDVSSYKKYHGDNCAENKNIDFEKLDLARRLNVSIKQNLDEEVINSINLGAHPKIGHLNWAVYYNKLNIIKMMLKNKELIDNITKIEIKFLMFAIKTKNLNLFNILAPFFVNIEFSKRQLKIYNNFAKKNNLIQKLEKPSK